MATTRIRCNVNGSLLTALLLEAILLGVWVLAAVLSPPTLAAVPEELKEEKKEDFFSALPNIDLIKPDTSERPSAESLAVGLVVVSWVMFVLHAIGLALLTLGYKHQCHKPLGLYLLWCIVSNLFILGALIYAAVVADDLATKVADPPRAKILTGSDKVVELPKLMDPPPAVELVRNLIMNLRWVIVAMIIIKFIVFVITAGAAFMGFVFFKKQAEDKGYAPDNKENVKFIDE